MSYLVERFRKRLLSHYFETTLSRGHTAVQPFRFVNTLNALLTAAPCRSNALPESVRLVRRYCARYSVDRWRSEWKPADAPILRTSLVGAALVYQDLSDFGWRAHRAIASGSYDWLPNDWEPLQAVTTNYEKYPGTLRMWTGSHASQQACSCVYDAQLAPVGVGVLLVCPAAD